ncbi:hypothetical protein N7486_007951 [Penicillium sp. IBT 16267x]|nr:hypothetical protein N7486_007951 [Penicillium sp. IBT 16267x]
MTTRPLLIPHKRPLLSSNNAKDREKSKNPVQKVLNPSAVAAETRMKKPTPYALNSDDSADEYTGEQELEDYKPDLIKFSFATPPQPFLDPPAWQAMLKRAREAKNTSEGGNGSRENNQPSGPSETADQRRRRQDREAEYGSMAIRGRSNVSGRGRRARGGGRIY